MAAFERDSYECSRETSVRVEYFQADRGKTGDQVQARVQDRYNACLRARGYTVER